MCDLDDHEQNTSYDDSVSTAPSPKKNLSLELVLQGHYGSPEHLYARLRLGPESQHDALTDISGM